MRKFVHSGRELFPHLVDIRQAVWRAGCANATKKIGIVLRDADSITYIREMTYYGFNCE